jgi:hypothetical protein
MLTTKLWLRTHLRGGLNRRYKRIFILILVVSSLICIIKVRLASIRAQRESKTSAAFHGSMSHEEEYKRRYGRDPPPNYHKWISYARSKSCSVDLDDYERINLDLEPFRKMPITAKMIEKGRKISRMVPVTITNGVIRHPSDFSW